MPQQLKAQQQRPSATYSLEYVCRKDMSQLDPEAQDPCEPFQHCISTQNTRLQLLAYICLLTGNLCGDLSRERLLSV